MPILSLDFIQSLAQPVPPAATTDSEGRYKLSNVAAGAYVLLAHAPAYVIQGERRRRNNSGKALNAAENDNLENVDITMTRGGVVTGKVTGFDLTLAPNAAIEGTVTIEKVSSAEKCVNPRESSLEEIVVRAKREDAGARTDLPYSFYGAMASGGLNDKGAFAIRNLRPGPHRIDTELPSENWYLKTMTMTGATPANDPRNGIILKPGASVAGLTITLATGAAGLKGKITPSGGAGLPSRLRAHLVPAEQLAKDDLLRFAETLVESNGSFSFVNLAPGKYLITTREAPGSETPDEPARPVAWDAAERAKLRKEAEAAKVEVELKACQRVSDFELKLVRREQKAP